MQRFGREVRAEARIYFAGGATAVLLGWRDSTVDLDIRFSAESDELLKAVPAIKEELKLNVELASPPDFIPEVPGWETRCQFVDRKGKVSFYNYDLYSQALSKIERAHHQDLRDVQEMIGRGFIEREKLFALFELIEPLLYKFPAIAPKKFAESVFEFTKTS